jgi:tetratricopeptide (TPR) repeat protein
MALSAQKLKDLGNFAMSRGDLAAAENCYRAALEEDAAYMPAAYNLGNALRAGGRHAEALEAYRLAAQLVADDYEIHNNIGTTLVDLMRPAEAVEAFARARALAPQAVEPRVGLATTLSRLGCVEEAIEVLDELLQDHPQQSQARYFRALDHLLLGHFEQGFLDHEARLDLPGFVPGDLLAGAQPWDGRPLRGETLLIYPEQGIGDAIQFLRYAPLCKQAGARVMVVCHPPLAPALAEAEGIDVLVPDGARLPEKFSWYVSVMSLGRLFGSGHDLAPTRLSGSGLTLPPPRGGRRRIGLCWTGSPTQARNRERSLSPEQLIAAFPDDAALYSLQLPSPSSLDRRVVDLGRLIRHFADTVAFIKQLDLVVTICSSPAHVAGSLGVPTWVLLTNSPDWRWGLAGDSSPLYPSVRLFRQPDYGDWQSVLGQVRQALGAN